LKLSLSRIRRSTYGPTTGLKNQLDLMNEISLRKIRVG
jgi:hypothetical protein